MDPRRARDPRLARADPRLQRPQSGSPAPTPPPPPTAATQFQPNWVENGVPNYSTPPPPQPSPQVTPYQQDIQQGQVVTTAPLQPQPSPSTYKQRPLFCVVCASNQVRFFGVRNQLNLMGHQYSESINGRALCVGVGISICH